MKSNNEQKTKKDYINSIVFYSSAIIPLNIIFIIRLASEYFCSWNISHTIVLIILSCLTIIGLLPFIFAEKDYSKLSKYELGESYQVQNIKDMTSELYLTQFELFILTAFAIPFTNVWADLGLFLFVQFCLGIIYIRCKLFYINPVLNLFGYNIFSANLIKINNNITYEFYIFSKQKISYFNNKVLKLKHSDLKIIVIKGQKTNNETKD